MASYTEALDHAHKQLVCAEEAINTLVACSSEKFMPDLVAKQIRLPLGTLNRLINMQAARERQSSPSAAFNFNIEMAEQALDRAVDLANTSDQTSAITDVRECVTRLRSTNAPTDNNLGSPPPSLQRDPVAIDSDADVEDTSKAYGKKSEPDPPSYATNLGTAENALLAAVSQAPDSMAALTILRALEGLVYQFHKAKKDE